MSEFLAFLLFLFFGAAQVAIAWAFDADVMAVILAFILGDVYHAVFKWAQKKEAAK